MLYLPLARKYRPQTFDEIIGQEHVSTTLKNAIGMDRVAHAYLFTGPRGVGKTSTARILAKSLNCEKGPTSTPCNKCTSCNEISQGISMDVIEIDGASNRGIDEIRNLKENIKFASVHGKFRIYIIDEVHMLTQEAFNALLKTLEEPPMHVKFIFATTRPYKVLPTVISRCQRFDFRKIPVQDISKKLDDVRKKEKLDLGDEVVFLIAKAADGSLRDAEVILDQLLSFAKGKVKTDDVTRIFGLLEQDILFDIANCILNNEKERLLSLVDELINGGKDPVFIASGIMGHFRNLMVSKIARDKNRVFVALAEEDCYKLQEQSQHFSLDEILYITYTLSAAIDLIKKTSLDKIPLEISLIKLTDREKLTSVREILDKLSLLEEGLKKRSFTAAADPPFYNDAEGETGSGGAGKGNISSWQPETRDASDLTESPEGTAETAGLPAPVKGEIAAEKDILLLQKIRSSWPSILNFIKSKKMSIATFLAEAQLVKVKDGILVLGFERGDSLHKETVDKDTNRRFVEEVIRNITGENIFLKIESMENEVNQEAGAMGPEENEIEDIMQDNTNGIEPIIESALDMFEGRIIGIDKMGNPEKK
ncbi:MAG: DNA polymerase III, subunit gamma and tau [Omnitrophica bacterium RBG_13_46_9]|nr:MAG: DNA polymerase III, subunit gamma and tau [Omnitrophica bacterium RBG_13_46_9]